MTESTRKKRPTSTKPAKSDEDWEKDIADQKLKAILPDKSLPGISGKSHMDEMMETIQKDVRDSSNDLSKFCKIYTGSAEDALAAIRDTVVKNPDDFEEISKDTDSYIHNLLLAMYGGLQNYQFESLQSSLELIKDAGHKLNKSVEGLADSLSSGKLFENAPLLSGKEAKTTLIARMGGNMKVFLYNSGFWVTIKSLNLSEVNEFYDTVDANGSEYGRVLGGYSHLTTDIYIKEKFAELIPTMVIDSNLKNWKSGNTLINNISFNDYYVLLWAACCMQFKQGAQVGIVCTNEECKHVCDDILVDLTKLRLNNFDMMPTEAIKFMRNGDVKTAADLKKYRDEYLGFTEEVVNGNILLTLKVPTLGEYLKGGLALTGELLSALRGENKMSNDEMRRTVAIYFYPMLTPWVSQLAVLKPDKSIDFRTRELEGILTYMAEYKRTKSKEVEDKFITTITDFIKKTRLSHVCASPIECPECHKVVKTDSDLFPLDLQELFFMISCRQLELAGNI